MVSKKFLSRMTLAAACAIATLGNAEILVILPETGPMASATDSIKRGFIQANVVANKKYSIKFVNTDKQNLADVLQKHVSKKTEVIVGPLDKKDVEHLVALNPQVKTLALNQVDQRAPKVYQFALSKEEDALALTRRMQWDSIETIYVVRDTQSNAQTQSFYDAMKSLWGNKMQTKDKIPNSLKAREGVLLLGNNEWLLSQKLPKKQIYTLPYAIAENVHLPEGLVYCDTPALYTGQWSDVIRAYKEKPVTLPFQRLLAFGGDAWQIADELNRQSNALPIEFQGRTGKIRIVGSILERQPQCFKSQASGQQAVY